VVSFLLSVTFACGVVIAISHVINRRFVAPVYDVMANLTAFACAVAASLLLGHWVPALLSAIAITCWLILARRTVRDRRRHLGGSPAVITPRRDTRRNGFSVIPESDLVGDRVNGPGEAARASSED
jgi:hypothetical protein